jgi:hypothetical protein
MNRPRDKNAAVAPIDLLDLDLEMSGRGIMRAIDGGARILVIALAKVLTGDVTGGIGPRRMTGGGTEAALGAALEAARDENRSRVSYIYLYRYR